MFKQANFKTSIPKYNMIKWKTTQVAPLIANKTPPNNSSRIIYNSIIYFNIKLNI